MTKQTGYTKTKGPWLVMGHMRKESGQIVYVLPEATNEEFQANARLIASAPELLEALKRAVKIIENNEDKLQMGEEKFCNLCDDLRYPIEKAEGKK